MLFSRFGSFGAVRGFRPPLTLREWGLCMLPCSGPLWLPQAICSVPTCDVDVSPHPFPDLMGGTS